MKSGNIMESKDNIASFIISFAQELFYDDHSLDSLESMALSFSEGAKLINKFDNEDDIIDGLYDSCDQILQAVGEQLKWDKEHGK